MQFPVPALSETTHDQKPSAQEDTRSPASTQTPATAAETPLTTVTAAAPAKLGRPKSPPKTAEQRAEKARRERERNARYAREVRERQTKVFELVADVPVAMTLQEIAEELTAEEGKTISHQRVSVMLGTALLKLQAGLHDRGLSLDDMLRDCEISEEPHYQGPTIY